MAPRDHTSARNGRKSKPSTTTSNNTSLLESAQRLLRRSYAGDYLGLAVLVVLYIPLKLLGEPFHQMFRLDDARIQYPHAEVERVGINLLLILTVPLPLALLLALTLLPSPLTSPNRHKLHPLILGFGTTLLLTTFLTDILKDAIGRPRPDLLARCNPALDTPTSQLVTVDVCTESEHHKLHDGFRSFPSGHSSLAWSSFTWVALYLASQTHAFRSRASLATLILCLVPLVGAALIAISRLEDYRHAVEDVIAGSLLGFGVAWVNWRRYWPGLRSRDCAEPYSMSAGEVSGKGSPVGGRFRRVRDEEDGGSGGEERERFSIGEDDAGGER